LAEQIKFNPLPSFVLRAHIMIKFLRCESFWIGVAVSIGCILWLSKHFGGLGHIPRAVELPGIALTSLLDNVPEKLAESAFWPSFVFEGLESVLDNYQCPATHEYRLQTVHHSPLILRLRGFLPPGEALHLLSLAYIWR
jgi:hypothetical protein